jgi:hypothetical protein
VVSTTDGVVTLELGDLVRDLGDDLGLPSGLIDAIPPDVGQIVLFESSGLEKAQQIVRIVELLSVLLFIVVVGLYAGIENSPMLCSATSGNGFAPRPASDRASQFSTAAS